MQTRISGLAVCLALTTPAVYAQLSGANQQVDTVQQRRELQESAQALGGTNSVPELYSGEADDVGPQSVLQPRHRRTLFEAYGDAQYFYTDNMFLASQGKQGADVLVSTVQAALAPAPAAFAGGELAWRAGYQHQWFNYDLAGADSLTVFDSHTSSIRNVGLDAFNFNASTAFGDITWRRANWVFAAGLDFRRLLDSSDYSEFYREYVPHWSFRRSFTLSENTAISLGYEGDYRGTKTMLPPGNYSTGYNDRTDHSLVLVGSWRLCQHAVLQPFYRFQYTHYTDIQRTDYLHSLGLTLYCPVTANVTFRAFAGYDTLNTDGFYAQNYDKLDLGGGLNLTVRF